MAIYDLYSKRQKRFRGEIPDDYIYDSIPQSFRVQVAHIWDEALGSYHAYINDFRDGVRDTYKSIVRTLRKEYGVFELSASSASHWHEAREFLLGEKNHDRVLDIIELSFGAIDTVTRNGDYLGRYTDYDEVADDAILELNARFREHGLGYEFINCEIIRIDSQLIHSDVVKPALTLLSGRLYAGAQDEFLKAHEHYRQGNTKEAINDALKSFESTMKAICDARGWKYPPNATSKALIDICFQKRLVPGFWQGEFAGLRSLLESGVPTGRNRLSGHGQGAEPVEVPPHIVGYILHMTAAAIVFLAKAEEALK